MQNEKRKIWKEKREKKMGDLENEVIKEDFETERKVWSISHQVAPVEVGVHDDLRLKPPETLEYDFGWLEAFIGLS